MDALAKLLSAPARSGVYHLNRQPDAVEKSAATAGLVAWQRIDDRKHDLSDVLFGACFGYAIGKAVSGNHRLGDSGIHLQAYSDPEYRSFGLLAQRSF